MINAILEVHDIVALRDGREVEVLSIKPDYGVEGGFIRFDYLDRKEASPMRRTAYPSELRCILRKSTAAKAPDPKVQRPYDLKDQQPSPLPVTVVNEAANPQVHKAVKAPAKPVLRRGKTDVELKNSQKGK